MNISDILAAAEESLSDILIVSSVLMFFICILFLTPFYQSVSMFSLFFGVIFLVSGFAIRLEGPLMLTMPSKNGFGTILICVSLVVFSLAGICMIFAEPTGVLPLRFAEGGFMVQYAEPLAWLFIPLVAIGIGLSAFGALLKFFDSS